MLVIYLMEKVVKEIKVGLAFIMKMKLRGFPFFFIIFLEWVLYFFF